MDNNFHAHGHTNKTYCHQLLYHTSLSPIGSISSINASGKCQEESLWSHEMIFCHHLCSHCVVIFDPILWWYFVMAWISRPRNKEFWWDGIGDRKECFVAKEAGSRISQTHIVTTLIRVPKKKGDPQIVSLTIPSLCHIHIPHYTISFTHSPLSSNG